MTIQWPDSCTLDGRKWVIEDWDGPREGIPTNEQLGFRTVSASTANWAGRIDHFLVHRDLLYLFKVEVTLHPEDADLLPFGARREVVTRHERYEVHDGNGMHLEDRPRRSEYLVFDDLIVRFTGRLKLSYPFSDHWEIPWPICDEDEETKDELRLNFKDGRVE